MASRRRTLLKVIILGDSGSVIRIFRPCFVLHLSVSFSLLTFLLISRDPGSGRRP
jgi:hypothetical protein